MELVEIALVTMIMTQRSMYDGSNNNSIADSVKA